MKTKILVVDDKQMMRDSVATTLQREGYQVVAAGSGQAALDVCEKHEPAAIVTDLRMPEMDGLGLLQHLRQGDRHPPVVLMTAYGTVDVAVEAMKRGAFDFIQKPFEGDELVATVRRAVEHGSSFAGRCVGAAERETATTCPTLVGQSLAMSRLRDQIRQVAPSQGTVLICGESGTGKEVVARMIHAYGPRCEQSMLCVNCAALSSSLLESELFGHEKGSFTGADRQRKGRFELADGGTLLLDEVSEIEPDLQAKLLRVLQERQFERVGSSTPLRVDVRVIATTNRDLKRCVAEESFRQDLYFRLNVLPIHVPPLRDRLEDIPLLAEHFLHQVAAREGFEPRELESAAYDLFAHYPWPGNVRELQNICERASVLAPDGIIQSDLLRPWLMGLEDVPGQGSDSGGAPKRLEEVEREQIIKTLDLYSGNRQRTAKALGIGVRTLGLKLKKWKELNLVAQTL